MNVKTPTMTAQHPATFGMPISGLSLGWLLPVTDACSDVATVVVRDRETATDDSTKGHMGLAIAYFPGADAWRPPIC